MSESPNQQQSSQSESLGRSGLTPGDAMLQLSVSGMHCHRCQEKVTQEVGRLIGVREVEVDFNSGTVSVIYDASVANPAAFAQAVRGAGYSVESVSRVGG